MDNVEVTRMGSVLFISYEIDFGSGVQSCVTELNVSLDGGNTFSSVPGSNELTGDIGRITSRGKKEIRYDIKNVKNEYSNKEIVFDVKAGHIVALKPKLMVMLDATVVPFTSTFGAMVGYADKFGGYVHYRTNFNSVSPNASYTCTSDGKTSGGGIFWGWGDGESQVSMMTFSAGAMMRISTWLYPYLGAGYGKRTVMWRDYEAKLVEVTDNNYNGVTVEGGIIACLGHFSLSLGASNLASTNGFGIEVGIGVNF